MRVFPTGATRDGEDGKIDPEGFVSPIVLARYCRYMHKHRVQADGSLRDSDNWQRGIEPGVYMKSLVRHGLDLWLMHRGFPPVSKDATWSDTLCAILFNVMGLIFETPDPPTWPADCDYCGHSKKIHNPQRSPTGPILEEGCQYADSTGLCLCRRL